MLGSALQFGVVRQKVLVAVLGVVLAAGLALACAPAAAAASLTIACSPSCSVDTATTVSFTASYSNSSQPSSVDWDFNGSGTYNEATGVNPVNWKFGTPGTYTVEARCSPKCASDTGSQTVIVTQAPPPKVDFTCAPSCTAESGSSITFNATTDAYKPIFRWDFTGSGIYDQAAGPNPSQSFSKPGKYTIGVRVTDSNTKQSSTATHTITIVPPKLKAGIAVATAGTLRKGELVRFVSTSSVPPGFRAFAYHWDFVGHGRYTADTGYDGTAVHRFSHPGTHTVGLEVQAVDSGGHVETSVTHIDISTAGAIAHCGATIPHSFLEFITTCITNDNGKYSMSLDGGIGFAGLELASSHAGAKLTLDTTGSNSDHDNPDHKWALRSDAPVTVTLMNTAIGDVYLGSLDLEHHPVLLPPGADAPDQNAPGLRVFTFEAQRDCPAHTGVPPVVCARLPGGFLLEGSISVYVTGAASGEDPGAALQATLNLHRPIDVSGHLTLTGDASGLHVDSFGVETQSFNIGSIATVNPIMLSYTRRDDATGQTDVWAASGGGTLRVIPGSPLGLAVSLRFANGGSWEVHFDLTGRVPLGPVIISRLGGTLGFNPFQIGGNLAGTIGPLGLSAGVLYTDAFNGQPWHFQLGTDDPEHDPHHVAPLFVTYPSVNPVLKIGGTLNVYGDGFLSGGLSVTFKLPNVDSTDPNVDVEGFVRGWFMPASAGAPHDSFQISGGVHVDVHVLIALHGEVQGFVNNYWQDGVNFNYAAGCGHITADLGPFHPTIGGWVRVDLAHGNHVDDGVDFSGSGCDNISAYCAPAAVTGSHSVPPCLGFPAADAAAARISSAARRFWIPAGTSTENVKLTSRTGIPRVRISGPSGTYTTPATATSNAQMPFISGADPAQHELVIAIDKPKPGAYKITPLPGTPAIARVLESHPLPDPHLRVHLRGKGQTRRLQFSLRTVRGQRVQFVERAADVSTVIGSSTKPSGTISFVPQAAITRKRSIEAIFYEGGVPQKPRTVAHYIAPPPLKPGRPATVHVRRSHNLVTIAWSAVKAAERYQVLVTGSDGRRDLYITSLRHRRLVIKPVYPNVALTVRVSAVGGAFHTPGPARTVKLKKSKR